MNVFLINGSPKERRSNTYRLSQAFLNGMGEIQLREVCVNQLNIRPCLGCFACWKKTPGKCVHTDDMPEVMENMLWADLILWSFPLYYFSIPGPLKNLMDRLLPMSMPFMSRDSEYGGHPSRYDMSGKRHVVISTCGFYTAEGNYDGVKAVFDHFCGKGHYTPIFCGQGELFRVKELSSRTDEYLSCVTQAGKEFVSGGISRETGRQLSQLLFPRETFEAMADASWGIERTGESTDEALIFTRQMAALYNEAAWKGKNLVLEMYYTDLGKEYQILLKQDGYQVLTENHLPYTTRIETDYTLWKAIAAGEISGQEALMQQKYRVLGDFDLMIHWDRYFGGEMTAEETEKSVQTTNMMLLLLPWIAFWIAGAAGMRYGVPVTLLTAAGAGVLFHKNRIIFYDRLSALLVTGCCIGWLAGLSQILVLCLSYLAFGSMWLISCLMPIPLTAHYSMNDYNGEEALNNPLFIKTNRILTACWGVLYLLTALWTWFLADKVTWIGILNSVLPMFMGLFTGWFQRWYPAKVARGE